MATEEEGGKKEGLPVYTITRIMKKALPEGARISNDAKEYMEECVTKFISSITSEAAEKCKNDKRRRRRRRIEGDDILYAMSRKRLHDYKYVLDIYLYSFRRWWFAHNNFPDTTLPENNTDDDDDVKEEKKSENDDGGI